MKIFAKLVFATTVRWRALALLLVLVPLPIFGGTLYEDERVLEGAWLILFFLIVAGIGIYLVFSNLFGSQNDD